MTICSSGYKTSSEKKITNYELSLCELVPDKPFLEREYSLKYIVDVSMV